jgi:hypothetical protein
MLTTTIIAAAPTHMHVTVRKIEISIINDKWRNCVRHIIILVA